VRGKVWEPRFGSSSEQVPKHVQGKLAVRIAEGLASALDRGTGGLLAPAQRSRGRRQGLVSSSGQLFRRRSPHGRRLPLLLNSYLRVVFGIEIEDDRAAPEAR
jgi:hypothetical protein